MSISENLLGKYIRLRYVDAYGETSIIAGKLTEIEFNSNNYTFFRMNPIMTFKDGEYKFSNSKKSSIYTISSNSLEEIEDYWTKKGLQKLCGELNKSIIGENNLEEKTQKKSKIGFKFSSENKPTNPHS